MKSNTAILRLILFFIFTCPCFESTFCQEKSKTPPGWNFLEVGASGSLTVYTNDNLIPKIGYGIFTKVRLPAGNKFFVGLDVDLARIRFAKRDFFYQKGTILKRANFDANALIFGLSFNFLIDKKKSFSLEFGPEVDFIMSTRLRATKQVYSSDGVQSEESVNGGFSLSNIGYGVKLGAQYRINFNSKQAIAVGPSLTWRIPNFDVNEDYINLSAINLKIGYFINYK